jgi:hypothetical protein
MEIKFRAWDGTQMYNPIIADGLVFRSTRDYEDYVNAPYDELMQFTGLHDSTKWEQLSEAERKDFYNKHCSEDGKTIKYPHVEDVKHLWKGNELYEGDILEALNVEYTKMFGNPVVKIGEYVDEDLRHIGFGEDETFPLQGVYLLTSSKTVAGIANDCTGQYFKKIGNIYENPELLK